MNRRRLAPEIRRAELLAAARRLLAAQGAAVRVEDVVREAGAAKGTFYVYFATWDDLLEAIRAQLFDEFEQTHPMLAPAGGDWLAHIEARALAFVDTIVAMGLLHETIFHSDFAARRPMSAEFHPHGRLAKVLRAGQAAGALGRFDAGATARLLFAVIHETADAVADGGDRERWASAMRDVLRQALTPRPQRGPSSPSKGVPNG